MNKNMRGIISQIEEKRNNANELIKSKEFDNASKLLDEIENLETQYEAEEKAFNDAKENVKGERKMENNTNKAFAKSIKALITKDYTGLSEGVDANGGYAVPEDIVTKVEELREASDSLITEVAVKNVSTDKGQETFKERAQYTGFTNVGEGGKIPAKAGVKFKRLAWDVAKYGGYMPVTNELLDDSDNNIQSIMTNWLANESRVTRNKLITTAIDTKAKEDLKDLDGIKKAVNVTLGSTFKATSKIYTNDNGLQYLDTLKDAQGRPMLTPSITEPGKLQLSMGATVLEVKVYSPETLANDGDKVPFIIGDLKEGVKFFDRKSLTLMTSNIAQVGDINAFEEDLTIIRGIEREDCKVRDDKAFVNGYITVTPEA